MCLFVLQFLIFICNYYLTSGILINRRQANSDKTFPMDKCVKKINSRLLQKYEDMKKNMATYN